MLKRLLILALLCIGPAEAMPLHGGGGSVACDSICQLLNASPHHSGAMVSGEIVKLTAANQGQFNSAAPTSSNSCYYFDGAATVSGTNCSGSGASPYASNSAAFSTVFPESALTIDWAFSAMGFRRSDGLGVFWGGGHDNGSGTGADSAIYCFSAEAAAAAILAHGTGNGGTWVMCVKPARFVTDNGTSPAYGPPSWSAQVRGSCGSSPPTSNLWFTTNADGQDQSASQHSYLLSAVNLAGSTESVAGTDTWFMGGGAGWVGSAASCNYGSGGVFVYQINATIATSGGIPTSPCSTTQACGTTVIPTAVVGNSTAPINGVFNPCDGALYSFNNVSGNLIKYSSPATTATATTWGASAWSSNLITSTRDVIIRDPTNSAKCDFVEINYPGNAGGGVVNTKVFLDLSTGPGMTAAFGGIGGTAPASGQTQIGMFYDSDNGRLLFPDYSGHLYPINFNGSNTLTNWTWGTDTRTLTGDTVAFVSDVYLNGEYLPATRPGSGGLSAVIFGAEGDVYLEKP